MQTKAVWGYIALGTTIRFLRDVRAGARVHGADLLLDNVNYFFEKLEEFGLHVTQRASFKLEGYLEKIKKTKEDYVLNEDDAQELNAIMHEIRPTLAAESAGIFALVVSEKRIDIVKLQRDVASLFSPGIFNKLPEIAQQDFSSAGKAIAYELPTAAAFHLLRATESVLREYYCGIVKQKRGPLMWGNMVQKLRARRQPPPKTLLDHLDHIRSDFRNPTQHPEKVYDIQEVQDLFPLCVDVVNRMQRDRK